VHMTIGSGDAPVTHNYGNLVQCFRQRCPEVPVVAGAAHVGAGVTLDSVVEVREFEWIAQEEDRRVVADEVPVSLLGIELHRKAPNVPLSISGTALASNRGKTREEFGLRSNFGEYFSLGIAGYIVSYCECAVSTRTLSVHATFRNHFSVKVGEFLQKPDILQERWPALPGGHDVLVIGDGSACIGSQFLLFCHINLLSVASFSQR